MTIDLTTEAPDEMTEPSPAMYQRRRRMVLLVAAAILVGAVVAVVVSLRREEPPRPTALPVEAWVPYWALEDSLPDLSTRVGCLGRQVDGHGPPSAASTARRRFGATCR